MTLHDDVDKLFTERAPTTRIGYKILKTKVLDAIGKTPQTIVNVSSQPYTFSLLTLVIVTTAFAVGVALGNSLDDIRLWIDTILNTKNNFPC